MQRKRRDTATRKLGEELVRIYELGRAGDATALLEALERDEPEVREFAARELGGLGDERAVDALARLLADPSDSVQRV